mgnify:CR=1 FL=1
MNSSNDLYPKLSENPKTTSGKIIWFVEKSAHNLKHFILRNKFFMDIIFILIYLFEQAGFLYLLYIEMFNFKTTASLFVLILLSTMAIEKVLMELRYTTLNKELVVSNEEKEDLWGTVNGFIKLKGELSNIRNKLKK